MDTKTTKFSCIILAGGEGKRVGGRDKGLLCYQRKTLVEHIINKVNTQVDEIIISANRNIKAYEEYRYPVVSDRLPNDSKQTYRGPMAGIAAALPHCNNNWVLIVPCDMPLLPSDIIEQLANNSGNKHIYIAEINQRLQLVFLMQKKLLTSITQSLNNNQLRLMQWAKSQSHEIIPISNNDAFKNFNTNNDFRDAL